ncbi:hypothetical protein M501DRAFT_1061717 [Patellaria atrata CBS 101060]|uniref:Sister chromatid cohesion protein Dcc1 n=1 Tax=Patellaria atrata CBS 101060 TaxID=1346257 RepID=A0A9P4VLR3_9PEZI|nr:hypothetical protein M501DRAFT_1061717 [Patellaria atrata CBS 101060]
MSTQDQDGMSFFLAHEQQQFRLLELPSELLELLSNPNPPLLFIKSSDPTISVDDRPRKLPYAVICTPNKTFQIRQVQTSNSVLLTQPLPLPLTGDGDGLPLVGLSAIAQCSATLETLPVSDPALPYLIEALPIYYSPNETHGNPISARKNNYSSRTKHQIFDDIPLSEAECQGSWIDIAAFEREGSCFRPSPQSILDIWQAFLTEATAERVDLSSDFKVARFYECVEEHPHELSAAVFQRIVRDDRTSSDISMSIDRSKLIPWIGKLILEVAAPRGKPMITNELLSKWRDAVPEIWQSHVTVSLIEDLCVFPTPGRIELKSTPDTKISAGGSSMGNVSDGRQGVTARKWHERFKQTRSK